MDLEKFDTDELVALAKYDLDQDRVDSALEKIKIVLSSEDCPLEAKGIAARLYAQLKLFDKAKALYDQFLSIAPNSVTEQFQLGMITLESGDKSEAVSIWSQLLEQDATHPPSLYYSAIALLELQQHDDATRHLNVLLQSAPADNLYFGKAKELLDGLNQSPQQEKTPSSSLYQ